MKRIDKEKLVLALAAPVLAVVVAMALSSGIVAASGKDPIEAFRLMLEYSANADTQVLILNRATTYYLAAVAVAIGFRMNLFNIGVDGQYRIAAMLAAAVGGAVTLPGPLHMTLILVTAILVGAVWSGVAGVLKTHRGVSEVVSTIMLNAVATALIAYLMRDSLLGVLPQGSDQLTTEPLADSADFPGIPVDVDGRTMEVYGFIFIAVAVGIGFHYLLNRTTFGFDLRAAGASESAAVASGVDTKRMVLYSMLLSGGIAGLIGMPQLLGESHSYGVADFPAGVGFTGIAIALLGRNNPLGIAFGALLWAFLDRSAPNLDFNGFEKEIATIMQGLIVISVVVAYELVRRYGLRRQQQRVGEELAQAARRNVTEVAA
ncbi:sugar ABC transporter permease [Wenjunlia vitaminophila]|uniref:Sugar ABC transporter permease n=1 Tax=Wenjunlia vitaminophila TaxID=76728 RepID=A0A0T6LM27_WENVI|nr:ABC transporter permease [Wenjunlia vitaminophila]KRV46914.1 sugar ABC transporter permease [Wenjunlia vitaminophila]